MHYFTQLTCNSVTTNQQRPLRLAYSAVLEFLCDSFLFYSTDVNDVHIELRCVAADVHGDAGDLTPTSQESTSAALLLVTFTVCSLIEKSL